MGCAASGCTEFKDWNHGFVWCAAQLGNISVFYKQRASLFYPVIAFTVPTILTRIPLSLLSAMAYSLITYFTVGFAPDAGRRAPSSLCDCRVAWSWRPASLKRITAASAACGRRSMHACICAQAASGALFVSSMSTQARARNATFLRGNSQAGLQEGCRVCTRRFFLYFLIMALVNQVAITLFRTIGAIGRAAVLCNVASFIYIAFTLMLCGFIIVQGF